MKDEFFESWAWKTARYETLKRDGHVCISCDASPATGARIQVDHIKPLRYFWS